MNWFWLRGNHGMDADGLQDFKNEGLHIRTYACLRRLEFERQHRHIVNPRTFQSFMMLNPMTVKWTLKHLPPCLFIHCTFLPTSMWCISNYSFSASSFRAIELCGSFRNRWDPIYYSGQCQEKWMDFIFFFFMATINRSSESECENTAYRVAPNTRSHTHTYQAIIVIINNRKGFPSNRRMDVDGRWIDWFSIMIISFYY